MTRGLHIPRRYLLVATLVCGSAWEAQAACPEGASVATLATAQGQVELDGAPAAIGDEVCAGSVLVTGPKSRAVVRFLPANAVFHVDQSTTLRFDSRPAQGTVGLIRGAINALFRRPGELTIETPIVNAAIKGTEYLVRVLDDGTSLVSVYEGRVAVSGGGLQDATAAPAAGERVLGAGERIEAMPGTGLAAARLGAAVAADELAWALYYPPLPAAGAAPPVKQAAGLLTVGRVDAAEPLLVSAALVDDPDAFALRSVIAVARNAKEEALRLAREAVTRAPSSAGAHVALSYALQARFDIDAALAALTECADDAACDSGDPRLRSRLVELRLATGDRPAALAACEGEPDDSLALACGFAELAAGRSARAAALLEQAVAAQPAHPLARLGLGLVRIRRNDVAGGRAAMEIAAALDPLQSVVRSYLGKAYFEERRCRAPEAGVLCAFTDDSHYALAIEQFDIARALDPNDPTPDLYAAIAHQANNRPVAALRDLRSSIEKNDNRAVYRSSLLLDQDEAARSAALARVYRNLGFEQLALVEGFKSVATDSGNFAAHRFLADAYSVLPRHEIARVSELLQSQLRQPLNATPVQPQLGEANIQIANGAGPSALSFNEFNPAFTREGLRAQFNGVAGANDTRGFDVTGSALFGTVSASLGYMKYRSDGVRENNDLDQEIFTAFAQMQMTPTTMVQVELRARDVDSGDPSLFFEPTKFFPERRDGEKRRSQRFGLRHVFAPDVDLLVNLSHTSRETSFAFPAFDFEATRDDESFAGEAQLAMRLDSVAARIGLTGWSVVAGGGHATLERIDEDIFFGFVDVVGDLDNDHDNAYLYSTWELPAALDVTLGLSFESADVGEDHVTALNPKFGLVWAPMRSVTLRGAVFRTFNRTPISGQTLEPTQVAGFNQFYNDPEGTEAWRYGVGLDFEPLSGLYVGGEASVRDARIPVGGTGLARVVEEQFDEVVYRSYAYWHFAERLALTVDYLEEQFANDTPTSIGDFRRLDTREIGTAIAYFDPRGFNLRLNPRVVRQDGRFSDGGNLPIEPGRDEFVVLDAEISYRLPRRLGKVSLIGQNLLDEEFLFQDSYPTRTDQPVNPRVGYDRQVFVRLNLVVP